MLPPALRLLVVAAVTVSAVPAAAKSPERGGVVALPWRVPEAAISGTNGEAVLPPDAVIAAAYAAIEEGVRQGGGAAVSAEETGVRLARVAYSPDAGELRALARAKLDSAYANYFALALDAAKVDLDEAANALARTSQTPDDLALLSDLKLLSGMIALASEPEAAARDFDTVVRLTPGRKLDALKFPPHAVAALEAAEERFRLTPVAQVNLETTPPDVRVALDGIVRGHTPLSLDRIAVGEHYYRLEKAGYAPQFGRIVLAGGTLETVRVHLDVASAADLGRPLLALSKSGRPEADLLAMLAAERAVAATIARNGPRKFTVVAWWMNAAGERGAPVSAELSAEPSLFSKGLVEQARAAFAMPLEPPAAAVEPAPAEGAPPAPAPPRAPALDEAALARDLGLLSAGRAGGPLDPPPPAWYRRWQVWAGAAGATLIGGLAVIARENAKPGTVDYNVSIQEEGD